MMMIFGFKVRAAIDRVTIEPDVLELRRGDLKGALDPIEALLPEIFSRLGDSFEKSLSERVVL